MNFRCRHDVVLFICFLCSKLPILKLKTWPRRLLVHLLVSFQTPGIELIQLLIICCMESLLKGKDMFSRPHCNSLFRSAFFNTEIFFTKQSIIMWRSNVLSLLIELVFLVQKQVNSLPMLSLLPDYLTEHNLTKIFNIIFRHIFPLLICSLITEQPRLKLKTCPTQLLVISCKLSCLMK